MWRFLVFCHGLVAATAPCRNAFLWPFNETSIWNSPIRDSAVFVPADLYNGSSGSDRAPPQNFHNDQDWIILNTNESTPAQWIDDSGNFPGKCTATGSVKATLPFPYHQTTDCVANNNAAGVLLADGDTLVQMQPLYRPLAGGPIRAWYHTGVPQQYPWKLSIRGDGALGAHGGSGLSSIGGTIRLGELISPVSSPIRHALKIELWSTPYYFGGTPPLQNASAYNGGRNQYVWPATGSDSGSNSPGGTLYQGKDRNLAPGALLAIPPSFAPDLPMSTIPGQKIKDALTNFGAYIVDDTGSKEGGGAICMEPGVVSELEREYGYSMNISTPQHPGDPLYMDLLALFRALHVVTNNVSPETAGGGSGKPLFPTAPPLCDSAPNRGTLHYISSVKQCDLDWSSGFLMDHPEITTGYTVGLPLSEWGCDKVSKGTTRLRDSKTGEIYAFEAA